MNRFSQMLGMTARLWYLIDARNQVVGRVSQQVATLLQGKTKPTYTRGIDCGDHVVLINTRHVVFTGKKWDNKYYRWHTGYAGGFTEVKAKDYHKKNPTSVMQHAIYGQLPKNHLRKKMMKRLHLFPDSIHPYKENISFVLPGPTKFLKTLKDYSEKEVLETPVMVEPKKSFHLPQHESLKPKLKELYLRTVPLTREEYLKTQGITLLNRRGRKVRAARPESSEKS